MEQAHTRPTLRNTPLGSTTRNETTYSTTDLGLVSTLEYFGHRVSSMEMENPRKVVFHFPASKTLHEVVDNYWNGTLEVEPIRFSEIVKRIKSRIYHS